MLFSNVELGVWYVSVYRLGHTGNHLCEQVGEQPLPKCDKYNFNTAFQSQKATASEVNRLDISKK